MQKNTLKGGCIMNKLLSIITSFTVMLSLSGCSIGNGENNGINRIIYNGKTGNNKVSTQNNVSYRDGIYTGYGAAHDETNEVAIVEIKGGRIVNVDLERIGLFRGDRDAPEGTQFNQGRTGTAANDQDRTNNPVTTKLNTTQAGDDDFVGFGNTQSDTTPTTPDIVNNSGTRIGTVVRNGNGTGIEGTAVLPIPEGLESHRNALIMAILKKQSYDVDISGSNSKEDSAINNWKLAVQNALYNARR